jgi:hypothetical protein
MRLPDNDHAEPLPTDGMDVEEFCDSDTMRLFMLEWRRRVQSEMPEQPAAARRSPWARGMMDT